VVPEALIDEKLRRLLLLAERVGALDAVDGIDAPQASGEAAAQRPQPLTTAEARALLRHAVTRSSVLVRNEEGLLPLDPASLGSVAVIGPNAATARIQGGGSASVFPESTITPLAGIRAALDGVATVEYAAGAHVTVRPTPLTPDRSVDPGDRRAGSARALPGRGRRRGAQRAAAQRAHPRAVSGLSTPRRAVRRGQRAAAAGGRRRVEGRRGRPRPGLAARGRQGS